MNEDFIKGNWKQITGQVKQQWGKLTDDDVQEAEGNREQLIGAVQERYGYEREQAESEVDRFFDNLSGSISPSR